MIDSSLYLKGMPTVATAFNNLSDQNSSRLYGSEGPLRVDRSAFDHIERGARFVVVGITPGAQQRDLADAAYASAIARGEEHNKAMRAAKFASSFGGTMRSNLVQMLDHIGAAKALDVSSTAALFDPSVTGRAHFTSALRYPVFTNGANYNGQVPILGSPLLRRMVETLLAEEVKALPGAIWQPLGDKPNAALEHLVKLGILDRSQIAPALPHPSGANNERIAYFLGRKPNAELSAKTNGPRIDALRASLKAFYGRNPLNSMGI